MLCLYPYCTAGARTPELLTTAGGTFILQDILSTSDVDTSAAQGAASSSVDDINEDMATSSSMLQHSQTAVAVGAGTKVPSGSQDAADRGGGGADVRGNATKDNSTHGRRLHAAG